MKLHSHRGAKRLREFALRRRIISFVFAVIFASMGIYFLVSSLASTPTAAAGLAASTPREALGVSYSGRNQDYYRWLGNTLRFITIFAQNPTSEDSRNTIRGFADNYIGQATAIITMHPVPEKSGSDNAYNNGTPKQKLAACANGKFDSDWRTIANIIKDKNLHQPWSDGALRGRPKVIIRLGHEHNLAGSSHHFSSRDEDPSTAPGNENEAEYKACWRRIHGVVEGITGPQLMWEWNSTQRGMDSPANMVAAYPGNDVVDVISLDFYDGAGYPNHGETYTPDATTATRTWDGLHENLEDFYAFASERNKLFGVSEWGLMSKPVYKARAACSVTPPEGQPCREVAYWTGGSDNPSYIKNVHDWFSSKINSSNNRVLFFNYFERIPLFFGDPEPMRVKAVIKMSPGERNTIDPSTPHSVVSSPFPKAACQFLHHFSNTTTRPAGCPTGFPLTSSTTPPPPPDTSKPDLIVTDITISPSNPRPGDQVTFSATIKNRGAAVTPTIAHGVAFIVNGARYNFSDNFSGPLAVGAQRTVTANGPAGKITWPAEAGEHTIEAHVDDIDRIEEANDGNNVETFDITVADNPRILGDFNDNGGIDMQDLGVLLAAIVAGDATKDLTNDGKITMQDLSVLLGGFN